MSVVVESPSNACRAKGADDVITPEHHTDLSLCSRGITSLFSIRGLELHCMTLVRLNLHNNKITTLVHPSTGECPLHSMSVLQELDLSANEIATLDGLERSTQLRYLNLSANRLSAVSGIESLVNLEKLLLSHNKITKIELGRQHNALRCDCSLFTNWSHAFASLGF